MSDRLFDIDEVPEIPLRPPLRRRGAQIMDARLDNDYPAEWNRCTRCGGSGQEPVTDDDQYQGPVTCDECRGMGSRKARVRFEAGHRCVRCKHPYMPKGDAKMLGVEPSGGHWSPCDEQCTHGGPIRTKDAQYPDEWSSPIWPENVGRIAGNYTSENGILVAEAEWRILTVHHLDGDKANLEWWNLAALCQRCHLEIQAKVVMENVYPFEHSEWFKPYAAGYYAFVYLCRVCGRNTDRTSEVKAPFGETTSYPHVCRPGRTITRTAAMEHLDALLALEHIA